MGQLVSTQRIDELRAASREIVRQLGFMQKGLAGTSLSPSAVHTIIELGYGTVKNAGDLGEMLHLEKSSVSRLVQKLAEDGLIEARSNPSDRRSRQIGLTKEGKALLKSLEDFGRKQMKSAFVHLAKDDLAKVESGLTLFAKALRGEKSRHINTNAVELRQGYCPGMIASVVGLHASYYATNYGFGAVFERKVATEMSEFMGRIANPTNTTFSAFLGETLLGSVSLDGEDLEESVSHLRWFIVSPESQGMGIGNLLLEAATSFVDSAGFEKTRLWTFKGLDAARHLYEKHGFELVHENRGSQWGTEVVEQEFERKRT
ncbi:helix-turn-helix domain-containing GNAT family N-acetyltransferase [Pseudooctadecabacter sp.]|uniref:helix-turn-helix domain-containing GNAT family N-acetyltransferase n=1 Tax=Pseudooctadecabacter sp. TaxID=1966338 RepID=UPI0035C79AD1